MPSYVAARKDAPNDFDFRQTAPEFEAVDGFYSPAMRNLRAIEAEIGETQYPYSVFAHFFEDGSDSRGIQEAIDYLDENYGGGIVHVAAMEFGPSAIINGASNIKLVGAGKGATVLTGSNGYLRLREDVENFTCDGITFESRIRMTNATRVLLNQVEVLSASGMAMEVQGVEYLIVRDSHFYQPASDDVIMTGESKESVVGSGNGRPSKYLAFVNCEVHGARGVSSSPAGSGIELEEGTDHVSIIDCDVYDNQRGVHCHPGDPESVTADMALGYVWIHGGRIYGNEECGVGLVRKGSTDNNIKRVHIRGVEIFGNGHTPYDGSVTGDSREDAHWTAGILAQSRWESLHISGCDIHDNYGCGISLQGHAHGGDTARMFSIVDNDLVRNNAGDYSDGDGIQIRGTVPKPEYGIITANRAWDDRSTPLQRYGLSGSTSDYEVGGNAFPDDLHAESGYHSSADGTWTVPGDEVINKTQQSVHGPDGSSSSGEGRFQRTVIAQGDLGDFETGDRIRVRFRAVAAQASQLMRVTFAGGHRGSGATANHWAADKQFHFRVDRAGNTVNDTTTDTRMIVGLVEAEVYVEAVGSDGDFDVCIDHPAASSATASSWVVVIEALFGRVDFQEAVLEEIP